MTDKVKLKDIKPYITCSLCEGYLIHASTITECLHSFCKSCIVKYLADNKNCPECDKILHPTNPLTVVMVDNTLQDLIYKLLPNLKKGIPYLNCTHLVVNTEKAITFYRKHDMKIPPDIDYKKKDVDKIPEKYIIDNTIDLELKPYNIENIDLLCRPYIRCPAKMTIKLVKKFVSLKLLKDIKRYDEIEIFCDKEILGKDHTLEFINLTKHTNKKAPLLLFYNICRIS
ncbi:Polycomb group RING finger protein 1 [Intoshia linei]|uniref:Polycomb group RING finger protein 1 n=1 Tax=Intoshia linei TaxID=1819745 RepID=A0A177B4N3_9BILA|nr:Polycomb group RING finger protein 1 [Intoshia linei]